MGDMRGGGGQGNGPVYTKTCIGLIVVTTRRSQRQKEASFAVIVVRTGAPKSEATCSVRALARVCVCMRSACAHVNVCVFVCVCVCACIRGEVGKRNVQ